MTQRRFNPQTWLKLLTLGIGVKRWVLVFIGGVTVLGLGLGMLLVDLYRTQRGAAWVQAVTLSSLPIGLRIAIAGVLGLSLVVLSLYMMNRSILAPLAIQGADLVDALVEYQRVQRGPKIVAIGGGTGMPSLLRGLKNVTTNITAIVTVADDGGSSGKLRRDLGVLPPGDFRNNLAALSRDEGLMTQLFQYRFGDGGLEGHSFGNLFITAMGGVTGSFEAALAESSRVLAIRGEVMPSTLSDVTLVADLKQTGSNGSKRVSGESTIPEAVGTIDRVMIQPEDAPAYPNAVKAILAADVIVIGPGSLYTSILPNLLVRGITQAIRASKALKVYVCNVATQRGETEGYSVDDHVAVIEKHVGENFVDRVLINDHFPKLDDDANFTYVLPLIGGDKRGAGRLYKAPLADPQHPWRHNSEELAKAIMALCAEQIKVRAGQSLPPV